MKYVYSGMQNRREFLKQTGLLAAGSLLAPQLLSSCTIGAKNIGLQLYSLRGMVQQEGIQATLELVSQIGYKNLETAGYNNGQIYGMAPVDFKKAVEDLGMKVSSAHLGQAFAKGNETKVLDWWKVATEAHLAAGMPYMVMPWMPVGEKSELAELQRYCDYFNQVGEITNEAGIKFGFHNHAGEFKKIGEHVIYDYMLANTDPDKVMYQLDVYWCVMGEKDPVEYLKNFQDRILLTHIKDEKEIGASGMMDFEAIFKQMNANKIKDWYVEVERYTNNDPKASVKESFNYLNQASYVR